MVCTSIPIVTQILWIRYVRIDKEFKIMFVPSLVLEVVSSNPAERYMAEYSNLKVNAEMHIETRVCYMIPCFKIEIHGET